MMGSDESKAVMRHASARGKLGDCVSLQFYKDGQKKANPNLAFRLPVNEKFSSIFCWYVILFLYGIYDNRFLFCFRRQNYKYERRLQ